MTDLKEKLLSLDKFENNTYLDFYCTLILNNLNTEKIKYKTQVHHSIPCLFYNSRTEANLDLTNYKVNLTYADHVTAHYYLCMCSHKDTKEYFKLLSAFIYMTNNKKRLHRNQYTSFLLNYDYANFNNYQELYESYISKLAKLNHDLNTGKTLSEEHKAKIAIANTGKHVTEETKEKLRAVNTGKKHLEETKKKISESHIGHNAGNKWMKKDGETKSVSPSKFDEYLSTGWTFGKASPDSRKIKIRCIETGEIFESCQAADKKYHCYTRRAINTSGIAGGYHWEKI